MQLPILSQKSLKIKSLVLPSLSAKEISGGYLKPSDWPDIRPSCPANAIALLASHASDFSSYDKLGFIVSATGGYKVYIDGAQYGSTYASNAQCSITWSTAGISTGYNVTTPQAMRAHIIWIVPVTAGSNITDFQCARVGASGTESQGIIWAHYNLSNSVDFAVAFSYSGLYVNYLLSAVTAKNNVITTNNISAAFGGSAYLSYLPVIDFAGQTAVVNALYLFLSTVATNNALRQITIKNLNAFTSSMAGFCNNYTALKSVKFTASSLSPSTAENAFRYCRSLLKIPAEINFSNCTSLANFITEGSALQDSVLDVRAATALTVVGAYGTAAYPMRGLKGLRVSSSAPFNYATAPQINVAYSGMTRPSLLTLFGDLPTVSAGQIVYIVGATGAADLTAEDIAIATAKGWTVTR